MKVPSLLLIAALVVMACHPANTNATKQRSYPVRVLFSDFHCGRTDATAHARIIADRSHLQNAVAAARSAQFQGAADTASKVDFDKEWVVVIEMGLRPTAGYRLALAEPRLDVAGGRAVLKLRWTEPPAGAITAQVITSPCILVVVPQADYAAIEIVDQDDRPRTVAVRSP